MRSVSASRPVATPPVHPTPTLRLPQIIVPGAAVLPPALPVVRQDATVPQVGLDGALVFPPAPKETAWQRLAHWLSNAMGTPAASFAAIASVVVWMAVGAPMHWDNTWLMIMSTGASIVAFLMVFVVQTSQNRNDATARLGQHRMEARLEHVEQELAELKALLRAR